MTLEQDLLARIAGLLESLAIPYMITGSMASSFHGKPRTTHDADIVIDPSAEGLAALVTQVQAAGWYVNADTARSAFETRRQFNVIDPATAFKVDLIIRKARAFSDSEFARKQRVDLAQGEMVTIATAEDTIVSKLEWAAKAGGSDRQLADARGIVEVRGHDLDRDYIEKWTHELGVLDLWHRIRGTGGE